MTFRVPWLSSPLLLILLLVFARGVGAAEELDRLRADLERLRVEMDVPALALTLVDRDGTLWTGAMGIADRASGRPADSATMFRIGSITKLFTALALLVADADGNLDIDRPLREIVPNPPVVNPWEGTHPLRVVHLLEHTAGLPDLSREEFDAPAPMPLRQALAWKAADRRTLWPPGLHCSYTNAGAGLAALALETATGQDYEDFVRRRIFAPLGMRSAGFTPSPETLAALATGYDSNGTTVIPYWHMLYRAFGAINVRPADMAAPIQLLLNRGEFHGVRLLPASAVDRMERPGTTLAARAGLTYGYGLGNYTWLRRGVLFHGHGGDGDGYVSRLGYSTERGIGYFLVINVFRNRDLSRLQQRIEDYIAGDGDVSEPPVHVLDRAALEAIAGDYQAVTRRFPGGPQAGDRPLRIELDADRLEVLRGNERRRLVPVSDTLFRYEGETIATSAIVPYEGHLYFQDDGGSYVRWPGAPDEVDSPEAVSH